MEPPLDEYHLADPTKRPSRRPPPGTPSNPALCKRCNVGLQIDDSFLKRFLKTSETGELYVAGRDCDSPYLVYGGINYIRDDHVATLPGLSRDAESGCKFCAAVKEGLQNKFQGTSWWKPHPKPLVMRFQCCFAVSTGRTTLDSVVVSVKHPEKARDKDRDFLRQSTGPSLTGKDPCRNWMNLTRKLVDDPWSPQNISMCQRWINECVDGMDLCEPQLLGPAPRSIAGSDERLAADGDNDNQRGARATGVACAGRTQLDQPAENNGVLFLPTRLLDVFPIHTQSPGCISLVETTHLQRNMTSDESGSHIFRYAALSYCWGSVKPKATTTQETLGIHLQYIEFSALPQCLQDAVTVTRGLGIRYLWIHALCIIQDDSDDWGREAEAMYQIFYNAFVTIGAAVLESFNERFLTPRPRVEAIDISFASGLNPQVVGSFLLSTIPITKERDILYRPLPRDLKDCKWDTRGWVWQEQKLPKRLLVFGERMIHFKCDHYTRSENGTRFEGGYRPVEAGRDSWHWMSECTGEELTSLKAGRELWTNWLSEFTRKQLTFLQDKLPAISGLSKLLDQNSRPKGEGPAQYLAGNWYCPESRDAQHGWQDQLFWSLKSQELHESFQGMIEQLKGTDSRAYTAPSWSWASRRGGVTWFTYNGSNCVSTLYFEAEIQTHQMVLTGSDPMGRVGPGCYLGLSGLMCRDPLDLSTADAGLEFFDKRIPQTPPISFQLDWNYLPEDEEDDMFECGIRLFGLYKCEKKERCEFRGLLLVQDPESRHYFRVGAFTIVTKEYGDSEQCDDEDMQYYYERWERQSIRIL